MKQNYTTPTAEKISFEFEDQITTSSGACGSYWTNIGDSTCQDKVAYASSLFTSMPFSPQK